MKNKLLLVLVLSSILFAKVLSQNSLPNIDNYTKGALTIKVAPFGLGENEIKVGHITKDGNIHFDWPEIDISNYETSGFFMNKLDLLLGINYCNDKKINQFTEDAKAADTKLLYLYNIYGDRVGYLYPATHKDIKDANNYNFVGSFYSWYYSNGTGKLDAICTRFNRLKDSEEFDTESILNSKLYNINFKKGWNLVAHTLLETREQKMDGQIYNSRYKEEKISIDKMPANATWYLDYTANDEALKIERELPNLIPITKTTYEKWMPKNLGRLKRTEFKIGEKTKTIPTINNIQLQFEKKYTSVAVTIIDCADNEDAAKYYTFILDMLSRDWRDEKNTGYHEAKALGDSRVMIEFDKSVTKTMLTYYAMNRLVINVEGINIKPEELLEITQTLNFKTLIEH